MCLLTRQIKPIITKKDMIVVKKLRVEEEYSTIYRKYSTKYFNFYFNGNDGRIVYFEYIPEILNNIILGIIRHEPKNTSAFGDADSIFYKTGSLINRKLTVISQGFHFIIEGTESYEEVNYMKNVFKFLVPKGSQIFLGKTGLGVSNQIIMLKP